MGGTRGEVTTECTLYEFNVALRVSFTEYKRYMREDMSASGHSFRESSARQSGVVTWCDRQILGRVDWSVSGGYMDGSELVGVVCMVVLDGGGVGASTGFAQHGSVKGNYYTDDIHGGYGCWWGVVDCGVECVGVRVYEVGLWGVDRGYEALGKASAGSRMRWVYVRVDRIVRIETAQRWLEANQLIASRDRARMAEMIYSLRLENLKEEFCQIRKDRDDARGRFRRLE
ncbi:hypothetical protein Tco_0631735 [Tanacetum coccineum]